MFQEKGMADSAFFYFNKAKDLFVHQKDSLNAGKCLVNMGIISTNKGDYFGAQEISLNALSYFDLKNETHYIYIRSNFNNLGIATHNLSDYDAAIKFYDSAIEFSRDPLDTRVILNNKAKTYQVLKKYTTALKLYNLILKGASKNKKEYARALSNISYTKWLQDPNYNVVPSYLKSLRLRKQENDLWGQNSSYSYLFDYYEKKRTDSALIYASKMYLVAKELNSAYDQMEALQKLIEVSPAKETKKYFKSYQKLNDSVQTARQTAKNQFALVRYETEKNKADNLKLQKDNTDKKYQIIKQRAVIFGSFLLIIAGAVIVSLWSKKRKQRLQLEAENTIRENQLRTSKKVHDVVANGLYRVMTEIENKDNLDRDGILDRLEDMYEKSRDISYEDDSSPDEDFHQKITELLKSFATETIKVGYTGSNQALWENLNLQAKYEIEHVLQELMVNMAKHSGGSDVFIKFEQTDTHINILYSDNGIGLSKETKFNNGLTNTGNRIKNIHGAITFDTETEKGLRIRISFPIC